MTKNFIVISIIIITIITIMAIITMITMRFIPIAAKASDVLGTEATVLT